MKKRGLYWFTDDLRLQDNRTLAELVSKVDEIAFVYVINPTDFQPVNYSHKPCGEHRWAFIIESLACLHEQLEENGHQLTVVKGDPAKVVTDIISTTNVDTLGRAKPIGWFEQQALNLVMGVVPQLELVCDWNNTLYLEDELDLSEKNLETFSRFRRTVEKRPLEPLRPRKLFCDAFPSPFRTDQLPASEWPSFPPSKHNPFDGGERAAQQHCAEYFSSDAPKTYKITRNELDGWTYSTKFSPWLAQGNVSPKQLWWKLRDFEAKYGANESTYWITFELLWREYFHWLALKQGRKLFHFKGMAHHAPLTTYSGERFKKWCHGQTPYPLVNACMHQLNATGYVSNRGRQILASCLVNELEQDWRYGAAFFQQQLIDYDVASNWGNWQYIAGVGCDPRGGRHFNLTKQTQLYDPHSTFISKWNGHAPNMPLDSVDAADWPVWNPESIEELPLK